MSSFRLNPEFIDENRTLAVENLLNVRHKIDAIVSVLKVSTAQNENFLSIDLDEDIKKALLIALDNVNFCISELS